jgi:hypothetical protein
LVIAFFPVFFAVVGTLLVNGGAVVGLIGVVLMIAGFLWLLGNLA